MKLLIEKIKCIFIYIVISICLIMGISTTPFVTHAEEIDITTSNVVDDVKSMGEYKIEYLDDNEFIFIGMAQYYDLNDNLRSYVYVNIADASVYDYTMGINISCSVSDENYNITESYNLYELKLINSWKTWYKLEVLNLSNLDYSTRRYNIMDIGIYITNEYFNMYDVEKTYIFNGISNNTMSVYRNEVETITITDKEVAFFCSGDDKDVLFWESNGEFDDVLDPNNIYRDVWYIFFNTDKKIDTLMEIDITYKKYDYYIYALDDRLKLQGAVTEAVYNELINDIPIGLRTYKDDFYLNYENQSLKTIYPGTEKIPCDNTSWWGKHIEKYETLENIMDMKSYKAQDEDNFVFTDYANKFDWGVKFLVTEKQLIQIGANMSTKLFLKGSGVCNTAILRLKFNTGGIVYNAYAVDVPTDDFTGNSAAQDSDNGDLDFNEMFEKLIALIGIMIGVLLLSYCAPVFKGIFKFFGNCFKAVWKLIKLPFNALKKRKKKK